MPEFVPTTPTHQSTNLGFYAGVDSGTSTTKAVVIDAGKMNRKCAAGTGAFLEEIAHKLDIPIGDFNGLAQAANKTAQIGS